MSDLVRSQLTIFFVMTAGGLAAGLCMAVFRRFIIIRNLKGMVRTAAELTSYAMTGILAGEFSYFCYNRKLTPTAAASFLIERGLWKRCFYGIHTLTEADNGEKERRSKHI